MTDFTRRTMLAATGAAVTMNAKAATPLTAAAVIDRIKAHIGVPWREKTVDGIIAGDAATPITGVATTMMATYAVLKRAAAEGLNLVVTHEPTFWSHQENIAEVKDDPIYHEKLAFITEHKLVSFHFHDHWHALKPRDGINEGTMRRLGWTAYSDEKYPNVYNLPQTTVGALTRHLQTKLNAATIRTIGNPDMPVKRVVGGWGYAQKQAGQQIFNSKEGIDAFIIGECWEWELQEYVADLVTSGRSAALIMIGHINSEQYGMEYCAEWMKGFVKEVPVKFLEMPEPYWTPKA